MSRGVRGSDARVRAKRIGGSDSRMVVESRTLGTEMAFNLATDNVSRTGFLLSAGAYSNVPFQVNTILELKVDTRGRVFREPIACLGKIVREEASDGSGARFGIAIVQMDGQDVEAWERAVGRLERDTPEQLPPAAPAKRG